MARVSGGALLVAAATHLLLAAALVSKVIERGSLFPFEHIAPYVGATICVLPLTCCLARAYMHTRLSVQQAQVRLAEIECLLRNAAGPASRY